MDSSDVGALFCCSMVPVVIVLIAVSAVEGIRKWLSVRGLERGALYCRACRYDVRGVGSWQCPECGADLRRVGLISRDDIPPMPLLSRVAIWTVATLPIGVLIVALLSAAIPGSYTALWAIQLSDPASPLLYFNLHGRGEGSSRDVGPQELTWSGYHQTTPADPGAPFSGGRIDLATGDLQTADQWLGPLIDQGGQDHAALWQQIAPDLAAAVRAAAANQHPASATGYMKVQGWSSIDRNPSPFAMPLGLILTIVLWALVLAWIINTWTAANDRRAAEQQQRLHRFATSLDLPTDQLAVGEPTDGPAATY